MARRIDHIDNPDAPEPNSLVPAVNAAVRDEHGNLLLIQRTDSGNWSLPGGTLELGENVRETAVRETKEETGIDCRVTGIAGIYSNPRHLVEYTSNGEVRQEFTIVLTAEPTGGSPTPSDESSVVAWVPPDQIDNLTMTTVMRQRITRLLEGASPYLD